MIPAETQKQKGIRQDRAECDRTERKRKERDRPGSENKKAGNPDGSPAAGHDGICRTAGDPVRTV